MADNASNDLEDDGQGLFDMIKRPAEPIIDKDMKSFLKKRAGVIDSLLSRKRYWISRWKRRIRN
jgi:hypothetical protein